MRPDRMWQNSKALPLIEWVSPGVATQTPLLIISPRESSCAQVLNSGEPEIRRSGSGRAALGVNFGSVSMVTRSDISVSLGFVFSTRARDRPGRPSARRLGGGG